MNIKEFSSRVGVSAHTIRYYEKIGVLREIRRSSSGHRFFNGQDLKWMEFVLRLKDMGMPLSQIQRYAELREQGDTTMQERKALLEAHVEIVRQRLAIEQEHLRNIQDKIALYDSFISGEKAFPY
ncbi:MerR family transcriptional regulator [Dongshaea marina]|uniref:MerR family transcriptional regulator n=1 Tax=Dongshaea marina TaxID=2047966 RepID=UPI000D3E6173|nr:MerR family transcriptional regulator [Dongshaea marina]